MTLAPILARDIWTDPFESIQRDLDRLIAPRPDRARTRNGLPEMTCDITETESSYEIEADLPGFERDQIAVTLESGVLGISAEREESDRKGRPRVRERTYTSVERRFMLPGVSDASAVDAHLKDGVLRITVAKSHENKAHRIRVR